MAEAVREARAMAKPGDTILLSPACASWDMFKDYADRSAQFVAAAKEIAEEEGLSDGFFGFYFVRRLSEVPHQRALLLCPPRDFACGGALRRLYCLAYSDEGLEEDGVPVLPIRALPARRGVYSGHR